MTRDAVRRKRSSRREKQNEPPRAPDLSADSATVLATVDLPWPARPLSQNTTLLGSFDFLHVSIMPRSSTRVPSAHVAIGTCRTGELWRAAETGSNSSGGWFVICHISSKSLLTSETPFIFVALVMISVEGVLVLEQ